MKLFDNIFEIDNDNYYGVVGLNKETNYIYIYNKFLNDNKNVLVLTSSLYEASYVYQGILNYTDKVLFFQWMILLQVRLYQLVLNLR